MISTNPQAKGKGTKAEYFIFPVAMLPRLYEYPTPFLNDPTLFLNDVCDYSIAHRFHRLEGENTAKKLAAIGHYFDITVSDQDLSRGQELFNKYKPLPYSTISIGLFWDFYKNEKTGFDIVCLGAYLALKSIAGEKPYAKTTNQHLFARMSGLKSYHDGIKMPSLVNRHFTERLIRKIKTELRLNWKVKIYQAKGLMGFYFGFHKTSLDKLAEVVEAKRKARQAREQLLKDESKQAGEKARRNVECRI